MATAAQINANRVNAQSSTGPRTEAGKAASSPNHLTLGLYTRQDYVKPEERDLYKEFCDTMFSELNPASLLEQSLAGEITGATWRLRRCNAAEGAIGDFDDTTDKARRSIERARASAHSILHRSINQLRKLRTERKTSEATPRPQQTTLDQLDQTLNGILNCPAPDWEAIDLDIAAEKIAAAKVALASNCQPQGDAAPAALGLNCHQVPPPIQTPRNAPCPCRSGEKFKRCCGKTAPPVLGKAA